jgi:hypothetical protein
MYLIKRQTMSCERHVALDEIYKRLKTGVKGERGQWLRPSLGAGASRGSISTGNGELKAHEMI